MLFLALLYSLVLFVDAQISFTTQSYTTDKNSKKCVTDCINGKCIIDKHGTEEDCTRGTKLAWQYYTYQTNHNYRFCLSRCGRFGENYDWCFVSNKLDWDYCNYDKYENHLNSAVLTTTGIPCKSQCINNACTNIVGKQQRCHDEVVNFVVAKTSNGQKCVSTCLKRKYDYRECYDSNTIIRRCAPPARNLLAIREGMNSFTNQVEHRGYSPTDATHHTQDYIDFLDSIKGLINENVNFQGNSVNKFIMIPAFYGDEPFLPLIVKASITRNNIPKSNSRNWQNSISHSAEHNIWLMGKDTNNQNKDTNGHLIAYSLGGPTTLYNFAPQPLYLNTGIPKPPTFKTRGKYQPHIRGSTRTQPNNRPQFNYSPWHHFEKEIRDDILKHRKCIRAELTVAVVYGDFVKNPRPIGFVVTEERYDQNDYKYYAIYDAFYSNDPNQGLSG